MSTCDHMWGDGPNEYSKLRTICEGSDLGHNYTFYICDRCKAVIVRKDNEFYTVDLEHIKIERIISNLEKLIK